MSETESTPEARREAREIATHTLSIKDVERGMQIREEAHARLMSESALRLATAAKHLQIQEDLLAVAKLEVVALARIADATEAVTSLLALKT